MLIKRVLSLELNAITNLCLKANTLRFLSSQPTPPPEENKLKKVDDSQKNEAQIYDKPPEPKTKRRVTRKQPFKFYFDDEEREKSKIVFYEEFFDQNTIKKDRDNFMVCNSFHHLKKKLKNNLLIKTLIYQNKTECN